MSANINHGAKAAPRQQRLRAVIIVAAVLTLVVVALGIRLVQVHDQTRDWRLVPAAAPSLLKFSGHDFLRDRTLTQQQLSLEGPVTADGRTAGGGQIFVPTPAVRNSASTPWLMVSADGFRYSYTMIGGF